MRRGNPFLNTGALLLLAACTRTVIVRPEPEPDRLAGSRPPPVTYDPTRLGPSTAVTLGIPPGHLPRPGACRIWVPGTPPGQQPRPRSRACPGIARYAPAGSWIVYRPTRDRRYVHVRVVDERRPGFVIFVRIFEIESGRFVRETRPEDEPRDQEPEPTRYPPAPPPDVRPREERPGPSTPATLGIPIGQLPEPGECRIWIQGAPPALQQRYRASRDCDEITRGAPAGSWVIYRPTRDRRLVHVRVVDDRRRGVVAIVRIFEIEGGRFVRETRPEDEPQDLRPLIQRPDRDEPPAEEKPREERPQDRPPPPPPAEDKPREERPQDQPPPAEDKPREERPRDQRPPEHKPGEDRPGPSAAATLGIPPGHLPEPGECRIWVPGAPPGQQRHRASRDCDGITRAAPAGSWIVYRPTQDRKLVHVRVVDARRPGVVIRIRIFDIDTQLLVREEKP